MKCCLFLAVIACVSWVVAAEIEHAKDGSGTMGYRTTPVLPWCEFRVHDPRGVGEPVGAVPKPDTGL